MISGKGEFKPGDTLVLVDSKDRNYLVTIPQGQDEVKVMDDYVPAQDLLSLHEGALLETPRKKRRFLAFRPTIDQLVMNMPRNAQVIYPKDLGMLVHYADIAPGQTVLEIGTGHGALTMTLIRALGPEGRLISCDIRQDHLNRTRKNIAIFLGESRLKCWEPLLRDPAVEGMQGYEVDRVISDVPEPWDQCDAVAQCLRPGGVWVAYVPSVTQMTNLTEELKRHKGFSLVTCFETMQRYWHIKPPSVRPEHQMKAHTGFIITCRKRWRKQVDETPADAASE
jgi:tRNA (adenine57-N1/adenine58-N1)-methyltransferase